MFCCELGLGVERPGLPMAVSQLWDSSSNHDRYRQFGTAFPPFAMVVFAAVHRLIFLQGVIKRFVLNQIAFCRRNIVGNNQPVVFKYA